MLVAVAGVAGVATISPARAAVTSISPSSARVTPGQGASATVSVRGPGVHCLEVRVIPEHPTVAASVVTRCDDEASWSTSLTVSTTSETPPGTFTVEVQDRESSATFRLEVVPPPPPPTTTEAPTTTTPASTTTATAPTTTTTAPPTTTTAPEPTTTTPPEPTTTTTGIPLEGAFVGVSALVERGISGEGLFLPLTDPSYRNCLPLNGPCAGPDDALVLVPARGAEVRWDGPPEGVGPPPALVTRAVPALQPVGVAPPEPGQRAYVLFVLDLAVDGGRVAALVRRLDERGALVAPVREQPVVVPSVEGVELGAPTGRLDERIPLGRPYRLSSAGLTEASPALVVMSAPVPRLLFGVRADPAWGLNRDFLPLLGNGAVPYLVRGPTGPPGLFVPIPPELELAPQPTRPRPDAEPDDRGGGFPLRLLALDLAIVAVAGGLGVLLWRRRTGRW